MDIDVRHWRRFAAEHGWAAVLDALRRGLESGELSARDVDVILACVQPRLRVAGLDTADNVVRFHRLPPANLPATQQGRRSSRTCRAGNEDPRLIHTQRRTLHSSPLGSRFFVSARSR